MADISKSDIKLMASQVLADTEDGGGQMTSNEIVSGNVNNLFPDISRLDRTYGRVSMRKAYISVQTDNRATYYGSHVALTEQAKDPLVNTTLFTTKDWFDIREDCQKRIEGYLVKGPIYPCALWGDHYAGSKAITVFTEENWAAPENGEVFVIIKSKDLNGATLSPPEEQFLRITKVETEVREFTDSADKTFKKQIITLNFGTKIDFDLKGDAPQRTFTYGDDSTRGTVFHTSVAADTSKYYGVSSLKEAVTAGSLSIKVDEIRKPLVPSTTSQAAITDFTIGNLRDAVISANQGTDAKIQLSKSMSYTSNSNTILLGSGIARNSLEMSLVGLGTFTDNGKGDLINEAGTISGVVEYGEGRIVFSVSGSGTTTASIKFFPAVSLPSFTETAVIPIQEQNRGYVYVFDCTPVPEKGTLRIDYLSSGKWYSLYDLGTGELKGLEEGIGSGTMNFETGSGSMTLGGMPDIGSSILIFWGSKVYTLPLSQWAGMSDQINKLWGSVYAFPPVQIEKTNVSNIKEGQSVEFVFPVSAGSYRVHGVYFSEGNDLNYEYIDGESNVLAGKCGYCQKNDLGNADFLFTTPDIPENLSSYTFNFVEKTTENVEVSSTFAATLNLNLGNANPIAERSLSGKIKVIPEEIQKSSDYNSLYIGEKNWTTSKIVQGSSVKLKQSFLYIEFYDIGGKLYRQGTSEEIGTVDYTAGDVVLPGVYAGYLNADLTVSSETYPKYSTASKTKNTQQSVIVQQTCNYEANSPIQFEYQTTTSAEQNISEEVTSFPTSVLLPKPQGTVFAAGSISFNYKGKIFQDNGLGKAVSPVSDQVYSLEYSTGKITPENTLDPFEIDNVLLTDLRAVYKVAREAVVYHWTFRTPGSPITPSSFTIKAVTDTGLIINATADFDGNIESEYIHGYIEYSTGIGNVYFGKWKPVPEGEEAAEWLSDYETDGLGNYMEPVSVQTNTIVMNCVVETYVPLDAGLLGLNPVKLPIDGKVPVFRDGDIVLIHHSQTDVISSPTAGQVVSLSRQNVSLIELYDNNGVYIPELGNYSVDLTAGEIIFEDPLNLSGYTSPFQAVNRIEDMVLATDVQITGHMTLSQPLQHDYPADETSVSSVLAIGDVQARIYNIFTDSSWGNVWQDTRKYSPTSAQYDIVNYPLITKNKSSVKERFACVFTSSTTVNVLGEHLGVILTNAPITADIAPVNPATGEPYFTIRYEGWGSGWSSGQVLRFNCDAGNFPVWFCRTTQQGPATENSDNYVIQIRGDSS
ncbi:MAG: hypothetical protein AB7E04_08625 [Desulfobacteraceae bacterium]